MRTVIEVLQLELKFTEERIAQRLQDIADSLARGKQEEIRLAELRAHKVQLERALEMIGDF